MAVPPQLYQRAYYEDPGENLTGYIAYQPASDIEERFWRALLKRQIPAKFRFRFSMVMGFTSVHANQLGDLELDFFALYQGLYYKILVDGEIGHFMTRGQMEKDAEKTALIDQAFAPFPGPPTVRVPYTKLLDQRMADAQVANIFDTVFFIEDTVRPKGMRDKILENAKIQKLLPTLEAQGLAELTPWERQFYSW